MRVTPCLGRALAVPARRAGCADNIGRLLRRFGVGTNYFLFAFSRSHEQENHDSRGAALRPVRPRKSNPAGWPSTLAMPRCRSRSPSCGTTRPGLARINYLPESNVTNPGASV
jgi:hypothetical protein